MKKQLGPEDGKILLANINYLRKSLAYLKTLPIPEDKEERGFHLTLFGSTRERIRQYEREYIKKYDSNYVYSDD